ncbi:MAG: cupin domain-containing protein [Burkholderiales bacterium]|nr:cupin domain-containing protein [Burkholderiales bacterium]
MAQPHLAPGEIGSVLPLGDKLAQTPSHALLKAPQLEVMRLVLLAGRTLPGHQVAGEITLQCLEGAIDFRFGTELRRMRAGDFLHLPGGVAHELVGVEDASLLLTVCLVPPQAPPG